jgi:hypothetical protein
MVSVFQPHYGREYCLGCKDGLWVGLTTSLPSCADLLKIREPQPSGTLRACPGLYPHTQKKPSVDFF